MKIHENQRKSRGVGHYEPSFDCTNRGVPPEDFWRLHGVGLHELFDSADPLVRIDEPIWRFGAMEISQFESAFLYLILCFSYVFHHNN